LNEERLFGAGLELYLFVVHQVFFDCVWERSVGIGPVGTEALVEAFDDGRQRLSVGFVLFSCSREDRRDLTGLGCQRD
jgi:hypothetical protein